MEDAENFVKSERFRGWSTRLIGCLAMQLCRAEIYCRRSALVLHLVVHLPLNSESGKNIHSALIGRSLLDFLCSCDFKEIIESPCPNVILDELMRLDFYTNVASRLDATDGGYADDSVNKEKMVFSYESVLHSNCDGLSETVCNHCRNVSLFDNFDLCDETLEKLRLLCPCTVPSDFSLLRTAAFAVSIVCRLTSEFSDQFKNVVENLLRTTVPDIREFHYYRNWFTLMVLVNRATKFLVANIMELERRIDALCLYIQLTVHFAHSIIQSLINGMTATEFFFDSVTFKKEEAFFICVLRQLPRLAEDIMEAIDICFPKAMLSLSASERPQEECARLLSNHIFSCCDEMNYTEVVRTVFAIMQSFGTSRSSLYRRYFNSVLRLATHFQLLQEWYSKIKAEMDGQETFNCAFQYGSKCPVAYLFSLCTDLMSDLCDKKLFIAVVACIHDLSPGVCSCVHATNVIESLLVENSVSSMSDEFYSAFAFHLKSFRPKGDINLTLYECHEIFLKNFSSKYLLLQYTMNLLMLCIPYCSEESRQAILLDILKQCDDSTSSIENIGSKFDYASSRQLLFIGILRDIPLDEKISEVATRVLILPILQEHNALTDYFNSCVELAGDILASNSFCSYKEEIVLRFCEVLETELIVARKSFMEFLNLPAIHKTVAILEAFMDCASTLKEFSAEVKNRLCILSSSFLESFFESKLNEETSLLSYYCLGQLIGLCLCVYSLFGNVSEAVAGFYKKSHDAIFLKPLQLWKSVLCCVIKLSFDYRYNDGYITERFSGLKLCSLVFQLMNDIISNWNVERFEDDMHSFITSICHSFITAFAASKKDTDYLIDLDITHNLYNILLNLSGSTCSNEAFKAVIRVCSKFLSVRLESSELKPLFSLYCRTTRFKVEILEGIQSLVERTPDNPAYYLVFPQKGLPEVPAHESNGVKIDNTGLDDEKIFDEIACTNSTQNSFKNVFERLLSFTSFEKTEDAKTSDNSFVKLDNEDDDDQKINRIFEGGPLCGAEVRLEDLPVDFSSGIFVSFWFSPVEEGNYLNGPSAVLPICCFNSANFSVYLDVILSTSTFCIIAYLNKKKIYEKFRKHEITPNSWTHITFSLSQEDSECNFQVFLRNWKFSSMNGSITVSDEANGLAFQFGAVEEEEESDPLCYKISSIFGFRGSANEQTSFALYSLGCDLCSLLETKTSCLQYLVYWPFNICKTELVRNSKFREFFSNLPDILRTLQKNHVFVVRSSAPQTLVLYTVDDDCSLTLKDQELLKNSSIIPKNFSIYWKCDFVQKHNVTIQQCLYPLGSTRLLVYFLAHAVDTLSGCEVQAMALKLLLIYIRRGNLVRLEFCLSRGYDIISRCFSSPLANIGPVTVKVVTELSIDVPQSDKHCYADSTGVIYDPDLLTTFCCCTDIWRSSDRVKYWVDLLEVISGCVLHERSSFSQFNRAQLRRTKFLMHLLHTCQRMLQETAAFSLTPNDGAKAVDYITKIISNLISSTETNILLLWDFIFLSHPAVDTYMNSKICGHVDWIKIDNLKDDRKERVDSESVLAARLRDYAYRLGKERIAELWARKRSLVALRKLYEEETSMLHGGDNSVCNKEASTMKLDEDDEMECAMETTKLSGHCQEQCGDGEQKETSILWLENLRTGVTNILSDITKGCTDNMIAELFKTISWRSISVLLTNQENEAFRDAVFLLLQNLMLRAPLSERLLFVKGCGFAILGSQLRGYPVSSQIADSLFSLCCGAAVRLEERLDRDRIREIAVDQFNCSSFDAIFVLWEESATIATTAVFWNITLGILKIFGHNSLLMQAMMDAQLCDVLVAILRKIAAIPIKMTDVENVYECSPLFDCWYAVSQVVILSCVPCSDTRYCDMCQRMVLLLECAVLEFAKIKNQSAERKMRKGLCLVLTLWMSTLQSSEVPVIAETGIESLTKEVAAVTRDSFNSNSLSTLSSRRSVSPMAALVSGSLASLREKIASIGDQLKCRYKWRAQLNLASSVEIVNRVLFGMSAISNVFIMINPSDNSVITGEEEKLFCYFICLLFSTWKTDRSFNATSSLWNTADNGWIQVLLSCRDRARRILSQLLAFLVFPAEEKLTLKSSSSKGQVPNLMLNRRLLIIHMFANDILYNPMLKTLLDINLDYQYTMNLALHELAVVEEGVDELSVYDIEKLVKFLRKLQIESPFANLSEERLHSLTSDERLSVHSYLENRNNYLLTMRQKASAIIDDEQIYIEQLKQLAMSETCVVVDSQNLLRKKYIKDCREFEMKMLHADEILSELAVQLCHPEAVCHDPSSWPQSWELDPTEGPNRERRRLTPVHLRFDKHFLLPQFELKLNNRERLLPLSNLLSGRRTSTKEWNMMESLAPAERIRTVKQATVVRSTVESQGEVLIGDKRFYFFGSGTRTTQKGIMQTGAIVLAWDYEQVVEIYKRHNFLKDRALEIFFADGQTYLIAFETYEDRDHFLESLLSMYLPNLMCTPQNLQTITQMWREGSITNFEYLMQLNKLAGRSFNDLMQYPVFPFVLSDYLSETINLADSTVYRDLSKPMAIQNKDMEQHYLHNYACLEQERKRAFLTHSAPAALGPYHYGSHYSNSGIVVHYLVRLSPFTEIALEYQDNSFDIPDRLFNSVATTWRLSSSESTTDFKELIPEFFYCHEFLVNREGLNLGVRQNGEIVNDVILPKWCLGNPRLFILIHRQALESLVVTASLHLWIDLIFGFKQTGSAAVQAINVFHPATYRGGLSALENSQIDPISVDALETMVRTYGQMPTQLFLSPHLPHMIAKTSQLPVGRQVKSPIKSVMRVRWGEFVGSPDSDCGEPIVDLKQPPSLKFGHLSHLFSFSDNTCFAYPNKTLLLPWVKAPRSKDTHMVGLLSWRFSDSVVRVCILGLSAVTWRNVVDVFNFHVTAAAFLPVNGLLFLALRGGVIRVYRICFDNEVSWYCTFLREFFAHESDIATISLCSEYAVAVTGCTLGKVCVWDTNKLSYVRTLFSHSQFSAMLSCVSATTCDVAIFLQSFEKDSCDEVKKSNIIKLFTVNGDLVGESEMETSVTAMTMTNLPEGTAVNCLVLGLENGVIRFLNMWTMEHLRDFSDANYMEPVVSLAFCCRCTKLYACLASGSVVCWHGDSLNTKRPTALVVVSSNGSYEKPFGEEIE